MKGTIQNRARLFAILACAALALSAVLSPRPAYARSHAGTWLAEVIARCNYSAANRKPCSYIMPPTVTSFVDFETYKLDSTGKFTFQDYLGAVGNSDPKAKGVCGPDIFSEPFVGWCPLTSHGTGFTRKGITGLPDFTLTDMEVTFHAGTEVTAHNPFGTKIDTGYPVKPGTYTAAQYLSMVGALARGAKAPRGMLLTMIVSRQTT
jgi:hypothetical protein